MTLPSGAAAAVSPSAVVIWLRGDYGNFLVGRQRPFNGNGFAICHSAAFPVGGIVNFVVFGERVNGQNLELVCSRLQGQDRT